MGGLLRAGAWVIAEKGYEPAAICAIAKRADSSMGSLSQFFPNKESVVDALHTQYIKKIEEEWATLAARPARLRLWRLCGEAGSAERALILEKFKGVRIGNWGRHLIG